MKDTIKKTFIIAGFSLLTVSYIKNRDSDAIKRFEKNMSLLFKKLRKRKELSHES